MNANRLPLQVRHYYDELEGQTIHSGSPKPIDRGRNARGSRVIVPDNLLNRLIQLALAGFSLLCFPKAAEKEGGRESWRPGLSAFGGATGGGGGAGSSSSLLRNRRKNQIHFEGD